MLRKRTRSIEKDQQMVYLTGSEFGTEPHFYPDNRKNKSLFSVPRLFVGLSPRGLSDSDSVRSPTSPLDFRAFSNLGSPFRSPKSLHNAQQKSWDTSKVGLSIIDSLDNASKLSGEVIRSESKNILFGPQMRIRTPNSQTHINSFKAPQSLPKNYAIFPYTKSKSPLQEGNSSVVFEIGETLLEPEPFGNFRSCSLDSCRSFPTLAGFTDHSPDLSSGSSGLEKLTSRASSPPVLIGESLNSNNFSLVKLDSMSVSNRSGNGFVEALSGSEIELSEDYTCVISHGPNPKTTHIYGDCILEGHSYELNSICKGEVKEIEAVQSSTARYPPVDFLSICHTCSKKLEGKDIYIYRYTPITVLITCLYNRMLKTVFD